MLYKKIDNLFDGLVEDESLGEFVVFMVTWITAIVLFPLWFPFYWFSRINDIIKKGK